MLRVRVSFVLGDCECVCASAAPGLQTAKIDAAVSDHVDEACGFTGREYRLRRYEWGGASLNLNDVPVAASLTPPRRGRVSWLSVSRVRGYGYGGPGKLPPGMKVLNRLLDENRIDQYAYERVLHHAQRTNQHAEDAIIEVGAMSEGDLLKYLGQLYKTQYVTTEKLARAHVDPAVLAMIPVRVAERLGVFPVLYKARGQSLALVAAQFEDVDMPRQIQVASAAKEINLYVARPSAVRAAIRKHYHNESRAFGALLAESGNPGPGSGIFGGESSSTMGFGNIDLNLRDGTSIPPAEVSRPSSADDTRRLPQVSQTAPYMPPPTDLRLDPVDYGTESTAQGHSLLSKESIESTQILVALIEQSRAELKGHSGLVAALCRQMGNRLGLDTSTVSALVFAGLLHDLGKASTYHLTTLNVSQYEGHRAHAQKMYLAPLRLFEQVDLPPTVTKTLTHLYEQFDGRGFPARLAGKDIPLGSRVLGIAETYTDLTANPRNPFRKVLESEAALEAMASFRGSVFDPNLLDLFRAEVSASQAKGALDRRHTVLIVDRDVEETSILEMRLREQGFSVIIVRDPIEAQRTVQSSQIDIVVTEITLPPSDGFELLRALRSIPKTHTTPVVFLSAKADRDTVTKSYELGASDFIVKPASPEVVAAKLRQLLTANRPEARGVRGSLREMPLPDVVQVLSNSRRTGKLVLRADDAVGEVYFAEGQIVHATFAEHEGDGAIYALLAARDGDFSLEPEVVAPKRTIKASPEALLLEGMRRFDESLR